MPFLRSLTEHFKKLAELPDYLSSVKRQWVDVAWGVGMPAVAFIVLWSLEVIKDKRTIAYFFLWALLVAGYYVWRADHIRLVPRVRFEGFASDFTPSEVDVQVTLACTTESVVHDCMVYVVKICKRDGDTWVDLLENNALPVDWTSPSAKFDLMPGIIKRVSFARIVSNGLLLVCSRDVSSRLTAVLQQSLVDRGSVLRIDLRAASPDCPHADMSLRFEAAERWFEPLITRLDEGNIP